MTNLYIKLFFGYHNARMSQGALYLQLVRRERCHFPPHGNAGGRRTKVRLFPLCDVIFSCFGNLFKCSWTILKFAIFFSFFNDFGHFQLHRHSSFIPSFLSTWVQRKWRKQWMQAMNAFSDWCLHWCCCTHLLMDGSPQASKTKQNDGLSSLLKIVICG